VAVRPSGDDPADMDRISTDIAVHGPRRTEREVYR
jgi:hypothetical protein